MKNSTENLSQKLSRLRLFMQSNPDFHNKPDYYLAIFYLGPKPKLGKNKTRKKIQEANRKYQRKLAKAKQSVEKLKLAKQLVNPLRRKLNLDDLIKRNFMVEQLPDTISLCNGFVGYPGKFQ